MSSIESLLRDGPVVATLGVRMFADALRAQDAEVVEIEWTPPPTLEPEVAALLEKLL